MVTDQTVSEPLDATYRNLNRLYLDRNFYRDEFALFTHLVEVVGGLSSLASGKSKLRASESEFMPKAIAWWLTLCGRVRISSVEELLWRKYPNCCPYCLESRCLGNECAVAKHQKIEQGVRVPDWERLAEIGRSQEALRDQPRDIAGWVRMFGRIYPPGGGASFATIFARVNEELGEMAEALRALPISPGYYLSEAADVFAWLMHLHITFTMQSEGQDTNAAAISLAEGIASAYPGICRDCGSELCICPAILPSTLGRIAREVPEEISLVEGPIVLSVEDAIELFGARKLSFGKTEIELNQQLLTEIKSGLGQVVKLAIAQREDLGFVNEKLGDQILKVNELAQRQQMTQGSIDNLVAAIHDLPPQDQSRLLRFLEGANASMFASLLAEALKMLG